MVLVVAGVVFERRGGKDVVLVTQRKKGAHLEGLWELPGGKLEEGEDPRDALVRELREELGIEVTVGAPMEITSHVYRGAHAEDRGAQPEDRETRPEKQVLLLFFEATRLPSSPEPRALDVADLRWADAEALATLEFPPADVAVVAAIRRRLAPRGA